MSGGADGGIVIGRVGDIADGTGKRFDRSVVGRDPIAVFNDGGAFYAIDDTCPHEVTSLADGWVEDGTVECPLHAAKFCLKDGAVLALPATRGVATHRVEVVGDELVLHPGDAADLGSCR